MAFDGVMKNGTKVKEMFNVEFECSTKLLLWIKIACNNFNDITFITNFVITW